MNADDTFFLFEESPGKEVPFEELKEGPQVTEGLLSADGSGPGMVEVRGYGGFAATVVFDVETKMLLSWELICNGVLLKSGCSVFVKGKGEFELLMPTVVVKPQADALIHVVFRANKIGDLKPIAQGKALYKDPLSKQATSGESEEFERALRRHPME